MIRVHYSNNGASLGRDFPTLDEALSFAEASPGTTTITDSDGVHMRRRLVFIDGVPVNYDINRKGRMVNLLDKENS